jgi:hypothetical protein
VIRDIWTFDAMQLDQTGPPTEAQVEQALRLGVDLTGQTNKSARVCNDKASRELALRIIEENSIREGVTCKLDKKKCCVVKAVGGSPLGRHTIGAWIRVQVLDPSQTIWVHPSRLSEYEYPQEVGG